MTQVFVRLHGSDVCNDPNCEHCKFIDETFDTKSVERNPHEIGWAFLGGVIVGIALGFVIWSLAFSC
jgi:hypothetical protein